MLTLVSSPECLGVVLLFLFSFELQQRVHSLSWTKEPSNPTEPAEGTQVQLEWEYDLDGATFHRLEWIHPNGNIIAEWNDRSANPFIFAEFLPRYGVDKNKNATLTISSVKETDNGEYKCRLQGNKGGGRQQIASEITLQVVIPVKVIEGPRDIEVYEKDIFSLHCVASGKPKPIIRWFKDEQPVGNDSYHNETATHSGTYVYKCEASNGIGRPDSASATVIVKTYVLSAPAMEPSNKTLDLKVGSQLFLKCGVQADPSPKWTWLKSGTPVNSNWKVDDADPNVFWLKIDKVKTEDAGRYTCIAENPKGSTNASREIHVIENSGKNIKRGMSVKITSVEWKTNYEKRESQEFVTLSERLVSELWFIYIQKFASLVRIDVFKFSEGSVVVHVRLTFDEEVSEKEVLDVLREDQDGKFGQFEFDKSSVKSISPFDPNNCLLKPCAHGTCEELESGYKCSCDSVWKGTKCDDPVVIIVLAVVIPIVVVVLVLLLCFWHKRNQECRRDSRVKDGNNMKVSYANDGPQPEGEYATVQSTKASSTHVQYENVGRRGHRGKEQPQKSAPQDQHAVADKSKKMKKPAEGELNYVAVSTGPRQPRSAAPDKPPRQETTYADIAFRKDML